MKYYFIEFREVKNNLEGSLAQIGIKIRDLKFYVRKWAQTVGRKFKCPMINQVKPYLPVKFERKRARNG